MNMIELYSTTAVVVYTGVCMYELRVELESKMIREKRKKLNDKRAELYSELGSVASRF